MASIIWERFGDVQNYVEPFFGSGAVLLRRPRPFAGVETVNDADGLLANFWRAVRADPERVAWHADWPVNEADMHARHLWLLGQRDALTDRLMGDPDWFDAKAAGWWVWGICSWIGDGWCSGTGPWVSRDGAIVRAEGAVEGVTRKRPHFGNKGRGIHSDKVHRNGGDRGAAIRAWFTELSGRLRDVRVACGDWSRVTGMSVTHGHGLTGVFLDPPYSDDERWKGLYGHDEGNVAARVRAWAAEAGENPLMRICLAGYEGEHNELERRGWSAVAWKARGGYGNQANGRGRENAARERLWFSPFCVKPAEHGRLL